MNTPKETSKKTGIINLVHTPLSCQEKARKRQRHTERQTLTHTHTHIYTHRHTLLVNYKMSSGRHFEHRTNLQVLQNNRSFLKQLRNYQLLKNDYDYTELFSYAQTIILTKSSPSPHLPSPLLHKECDHCITINMKR
jgi:hypothetical protein